MKHFAFAILTALALSPTANAYEGSWFAAGPSYDNLASGTTQSGLGLAMEGGYWYLGNVAYGGYFKANFLGQIGDNAGSNLKIYDFGGFFKAATEAGLYGKVLLGLAFLNTSGNANGFKVGDGKSLSLGLGGGFLFPLADGFQIGPEVIYRHLTAGNGGDQISVGGLVAYSF